MPSPRRERSVARAVAVVHRPGHCVVAAARRRRVRETGTSDRPAIGIVEKPQDVPRTGGCPAPLPPSMITPFRRTYDPSSGPAWEAMR